MADEKMQEVLNESEETEHLEEEYDIIVLTLEDDTELECAVLEIFPFEGKRYVALVSLDEEQKVLLYEFEEKEDSEEIELNLIESEEEFDKVAEEFNRIMEEHEAQEQD